ncbi:MAG: Holliday junction resolvase RuvX [Armatimonadota bacterium]|nr:Holliday junction resolvase RuvX [Armatimonadota bacterium]MDR7450435.1 Holliday junction resolvase RuvX [Armatimonadota bacterium]MDR7466982.1 Holliday junction resolvase RuvX [Armatimonadota bacterium]MDR7493476.1 Holliday junction resolvase RuvX [Armatimonadota bacterium]MDR7498741.1 Holliday junction resolvase RuvX [Armatimonadota bacterium]
MGGRVLALDVGTRRIGVAVSDPTGTIAHSHAVLPRTSWADLLRRLRRIIADQEVERVVVGLPLRLDGREGPAAEEARAFARRLRRELPLPVVLQDERLSTAEAERAMVLQDARRGVRRRRRDAVAAAIFLQTYLERCRRDAGAADDGEEGRRDESRDHHHTPGR